METAPTKKVINIDVVSDNICPWCFVGKRRMEQAMKEYPDVDFKVNWLPFFLNPPGAVPEQGMDKMEHLVKKYGERIIKGGAVQHLQAQGREVGINFAYDLVVPTLNSHRLNDYAKQYGKLNEVIEDVFHSYFESNKNINNIDVLVEIGERHGLPNVREYLLGDKNKAEIAEEAEKWTGIGGVPFFVGSKPGSKKKLALSGAQAKDAFVDLFETLLESK